MAATDPHRRTPPVSALPTTFRAFVAERHEDRVERGIRPFASAELAPGDVEIRIAWSSVNFKDGLATRFDGRVARINPLIPGIDLAGEVVGGDSPAFAPGDQVLAHGYDLGVGRHGGYGEYTRVPAAWVVPLPAGLAVRDAMAIGTAGFTAAMSVDALERHGLRPDRGPVLVTGATGGVGSTAIAILAERGYETWAVTGKADEHDWLRSLGAVGFLTRDEVAAAGKPLESERWAGVVDSVGAASLPYALRTVKMRGAVASSGNAGGVALHTTVFPFILRGVALLGIDSANLPIDERRTMWARLADDLRPRALGERVSEVGLDDLEVALDGILAGAARGRWVVRVAD